MILGEAFQVCYVVADRASGVRQLSARLGLAGWVELQADLDVDGDYGGGEMTVAVAFARWGRLVVEVLQPVHDPLGLFGDAMGPDDAPRVHHVGVRVADVVQARAQAAAYGAPCVLAGGLAEELRVAFVDARSWLGHYLELVQFGPQGWDLMAGILDEKQQG